MGIDVGLGQSLLLVDPQDVGADQVRHPHGVFDQFEEGCVVKGLADDKFVAVAVGSADDVGDLAVRGEQERNVGRIGGGVDQVGEADTGIGAKGFFGDDQIKRLTRDGFDGSGASIDDFYAVFFGSEKCRNAGSCDGITVDDQDRGLEN